MMEDPLVAREDGAESAEVIDLRRRVAFYEGFDGIIKENVARAGDLLRLASERQAEADHAAAVARQDWERDTERYRATLVALLSEVRALDDAVETVAGRLSEAIELTAVSGTPLDTRFGGTDFGVMAVERSGSSPPPLNQTSLNPAPAVAEMPDDEERVGCRESRENGLVQPGVAERSRGAGDEVRQAVVVHGLGDVTQARSLVDHLRERTAIDTVEPKEFIGGVLRLAIAGRRPVHKDDLSTWVGGEVDTAEEDRDTLVLRLPSTPTL